MNSRLLWSRIVKVVGCIAMVLGTLRPIEGAMLVLPGCGLVALGMYIGGKGRKTVVYWVWAFLLMAFGIGAFFGLKAWHIGGTSGHSKWWAVLMLPYPVGWLMALASGVAGLVRLVKARRRREHA